MPYPIALDSLTPREAITDALYRALIGFDRNDTASFESAFIDEDVSFEIKEKDAPPRAVTGLSTIRNGVLASVGPMDTTHVISNVRIDVKGGADTASLTCNAVAQHCPPGRGKEPDGPKYLVGGEYTIDVVKDKTDGLWKVKKWVMDIIWKQGDPSVMGH